MSYYTVSCIHFDHINITNQDYEVKFPRKPQCLPHLTCHIHDPLLCCSTVPEKWSWLYVIVDYWYEETTCRLYHSLIRCWAWPEEMSNHIQALHFVYAPALKMYFGFSSLSTIDMDKTDWWGGLTWSWAWSQAILVLWAHPVISYI
jgi:hypothetical protein